MQNFMDFPNSTNEKIDRENEYYNILGDINFDLFKLDSRPDTDNFWGLSTSNLIFYNLLELNLLELLI